MLTALYSSSPPACSSHLCPCSPSAACDTEPFKRLSQHLLLERALIHEHQSTACNLYPPTTLCVALYWLS